MATLSKKARFQRRSKTIQFEVLGARAGQSFSIPRYGLEVKDGVVEADEGLAKILITYHSMWPKDQDAFVIGDYEYSRPEITAGEPEPKKQGRPPKDQSPKSDKKQSDKKAQESQVAND